MLINKIYRLLPGMALLTLLSSCDKYLNEPPSKTSSLVVTTTAQLNALLNNYSTFYQEGNRTAIYSTDDADLPLDLYNARPSTFSMAQVEFTLWDINNLPDDGRESFWSGEYKKIFNANMALSYADKVTGTEDEKAVIKADAHFIRAYSYWVLANTYCLPFTDANKQEAGLPLKLGTGFEEPVVRQPLEKVYSLIESDLAEALKTPVSLTGGGTPRHWRASKAGVNGFAARYYLNRNNYTEALKYANAALTEYSQLVDYNTEMKYGNDGNVTINAGTPNAQTVTIKYPYTHNNQSDMTDMIGWKEFLYFRMLYHESWWYIPSKALLDLYDQDHDLRYEYHIVENYSYDRGLIKPAYSYPGYIFFFKDRIPSGPTVAEMLLIKAECQARANNISDAMTAVNTLRAKRMKPGPWVNLTAAGKDAAIKLILEERRREMPFTQRWFDIRRLNNNEDPNDDVVLNRTFYPYNNAKVSVGEPTQTYSLPKNGRRFAAPLPRTEIISSNGLIEQNKY
ncbi:SusD-like starch-binding protein associating with outer membrane [Chitinophaga polysaccharea]|uniref:SusD-like starch-binding protein associating with outer membrane n=1 Tax=Chitinophaga polysaccharea TaxID=1293035 RepID=A0A561PLH8_9BACT|nr:RagB/SusD family nutrient uptake outer membrane protein [Chitinophaga polysaccharea]TWF38973.1 SusD-like starch-binding protein associating with outer membrane [Chitinophaga polysaccharea]